MKKPAGIRGYTLSLALMIWVMTAAAGLAQQPPEVKTVIVVGSSRIMGNDMSNGRAQAIEDGLVAAAYQVLAGFLPQEVFASGFQAINAAVFSKTDQFINDYKVLTESVDGKTYRLLIQAGVSVQRIKDTLKKADIWADRDNLPRVLLCVAEKQVDEQDYHYWWSGSPIDQPAISNDVLSASLTADRFILIRPDAGRLNAVVPLNLSASQAVSLGRMFEADVVVAGLAEAEAAPNTMGGKLRSFRGTINLKAYRVSDGEPIGQSQRSALSAAQESAGGGQEALRRVADQTAKEISLMIQEVWRSEGSDKYQLELWVAGTGGNMANFVKFRGAVSTMSGVNSIQLKEMTPDDAVLLVAYQGNARSLADALLLQSFDAFGIHISEVSLNQIRLQLIPR